MRLKAPPSPSRSIYTPLQYEVKTILTPIPRISLTLTSSTSGINLCTDTEPTAAAAQNNSSSDDEPTRQPYITSLIYAEDQQIPLSEYDDFFIQPASINDQEQVTAKNMIVASRSMPISLDQSDYIEPLAYTSNEVIDTDLEHGRFSPTELASSKVEARSDGYLDMSAVHYSTTDCWNNQHHT